MLTYEFVIYLGKLGLLALVAVTLVLLLLDLALGAVLLRVTARRRSLLLLAPVNWIAWFVAAGWLPQTLQVGQASFSPRPWADLLALPLATACAGVGAALLIALRLVAASMRDPREVASGGQRQLPQRLNRPVSSGVMGGILDGLTAPLDGLIYLCHYPALWRFGIVPVVLNLLITAVVTFGLIVAVAAAVTYLDGQFPEGWGYLVLEVLTAAALVLLAIGGAVVSWLILQGVLCGYFYGVLARHVEIQLGTPPEELREVSLGYQMLDTLIDVTVLIAINLGLLLLNLLPVLGSVLAFCGGVYFNTFILGLEFLDYPLALRGLRRPEKRAYAKRRRPITCGLGLAVMGLNLAPIIGALFLTTAAAGGVLLHRRIKMTEQEGRKNAESTLERVEKSPSNETR